MQDELAMTEQPPHADPELTKAVDFAILKASELLSQFGITVDSLRIVVTDQDMLLNTFHTYASTGTKQ